MKVSTKDSLRQMGVFESQLEFDGVRLQEDCDGRAVARLDAN